MNIHSVKRAQKDAGMYPIQLMIEDGSIWSAQEVDVNVQDKIFTLLKAGYLLLGTEETKDGQGYRIPSRNQVQDDPSSYGSFKRCRYKWEGTGISGFDLNSKYVQPLLDNPEFRRMYREYESKQ